ncbi:hypothetical protein [Staphylococcus warneri]|jgi:hypothetical protein|uniref:hypothetical protein n=1 Tax=Staphylococcus warneri TaxID=1292 RepID=UPI000F526FDC|nr:hypothetical protein [Staphylococcus warneri]MDH8713016.1 hypothetical protein [Staphylococcus epidermidis]RQM99395.1 hypothetical protein CPA44_02925 [Staphylococcus warneri]
MDKNLFDKKFDELKEFLEVELNIESDYFKETQQKFYELYPDMSDEMIFNLSLHELNKKYSQALTYNVSLLLLKDDEQNQ